LARGKGGRVPATLPSARSASTRIGSKEKRTRREHLLVNLFYITNLSLSLSLQDFEIWCFKGYHRLRGTKERHLGPTFIPFSTPHSLPSQCHSSQNILRRALCLYWNEGIPSGLDRTTKPKRRGRAVKAVSVASGHGAQGTTGAADNTGVLCGIDDGGDRPPCKTRCLSASSVVEGMVDGCGEQPLLAMLSDSSL